MAILVENRNILDSDDHKKKKNNLDKKGNILTQLNGKHGNEVT